MLGGRLVALVVLATALASRPAIAGDRITELTTMLSSSSEKTRMSAVLSLARLRDQRAMKPLITALQDPNPQVRVVAATALGKLANKTTFVALKAAAIDDTDETVRKAARDAAIAVAKANKLEDDLPPAPPDSGSAAPTASASPPVQARKTGFGRQPKAVTDQPDLYVLVKGCNDDSPGKADKNTRKTHADVLMTALKTSLGKAPQVTMLPDEAARWGLDARSIDVSVVKLEIVQSASYVEVATELRLAISDDKGKMLSFLSGGAKVQIPIGKYKPGHLPNMKKEALEGALDGLFAKLLVHLRQITTT